MRGSRLPIGGSNVLQAVRAKRREAEEAGVKLLDLSIGEPKGPALLSAREAAAIAVMSEDEAMHSYQYNDSQGVPGFARKFIQAHVPRSLEDGDVDYLTIPGIKPILGMLPLACGCADQDITVATTTDPGYPIPADWCAYHPRSDHYALSLNPENDFRFPTRSILNGTNLVMMNYPHNPSGQIAQEDWLREVCQFCSDRDIRLFNDAAYIILSHGPESATLSQVALDFPDLSWAEAFTAAKLIGNGTGWHVGAMVGSPDFIGDIKEVKGKTDTGFVAPMAAGVAAAFESDQEGISRYCDMYRSRLWTLIEIMTGQGMRLAIEPSAGFFTLWLTPTRAFGQPVESSQDFNFRMITETGLVGVHFSPYLRYAVCADIESMASDITDAFRRAAVSYD